MAIDAAAEFLADGSIRLEIIGEGPEQSALQAQVARLGLTQAVTFAGKVKHTELNQRLREADLLIFPSVREFGGAVVLEAMACGAVPIVVAFGGPGELTSPQTGFAVPLTDRAGVVAAVRQVLQHLVSDTSALPEMSRRAAQRARRLFSWDNKARQTLEVYHWVMGHRPDKPELPIPLPDPDPSTSSFQPLPASS
jgi:glycosyltransferase involved in cell wall biosynthesis